jgi:hypothetical protein
MTAPHTGYLTRLKGCVVDALSTVFNSTFPDPRFRGLKVSIEYPLDQQSYPSIWVNYDDSDSLEIASIDHREFLVDTDGLHHEVTRWNFAGSVTLTVVALSSLERDALYDEVVRIFAFSRIEEANPDFRTILETNDFLYLAVNWDQLRPHGDAAAPGTPWGSEDEVIYERSLGFDVEGEFVSDWRTNTLVPLREIVVVGEAVNDAGDPLGLEPMILGIGRTD